MRISRWNSSITVSELYPVLPVFGGRKRLIFNVPICESGKIQKSGFPLVISN
jgi:hypothetical protein